MKIKLIHYPYKDFQIGEIVDFGEEINKSLVSFDRAVWIEPTTAPVKTAIKKVVAAISKPKSTKKKVLLSNTLREKVQEKKKRAKFD